MPKLKIGPIPDDRPVKLTIELPAALRESQQLFNAFMDNTPAVAFMRDEARSRRLF